MTILLRKKSVSKLCFAQKRYGSRETQISIVGRALQERAIIKNAHFSRRMHAPTLRSPGQNVLFSDAAPHMRNHTLQPDCPSSQPQYEHPYLLAEHTAQSSREAQ